MSRPTLITVAHGTRDHSGNGVAEALTRAAGEALGVPALTTYVELSSPLLADEMAALSGPGVVVPLLLSTGFHVRQDLPEAVALSRESVLMTPQLGPDLALAQVVRARLIQSGAELHDPVVLVAAGTRDPAGLADLEQAVVLMREVWRGSVRLATLTGSGPNLSEAVVPARAEGRVAVAPYLLAPGYFALRARRESLAAGATTVADVIGCHRHVVDLIMRRYALARATALVPPSEFRLRGFWLTPRWSNREVLDGLNLNFAPSSAELTTYPQ